MRVTEMPVREVDLYLSGGQKDEILSRKARHEADPSIALTTEDLDRLFALKKEKRTS